MKVNIQCCENKPLCADFLFHSVWVNFFYFVVGWRFGADACQWAVILQHYTTLARSLTFFSFVFTVECVCANVRIVRSIFTRKIGEGVGITIPPSIRTFGNKVVYRHTHSFSEYFTDSFVPFPYMFHFFFACTSFFLLKRSMNIYTVLCTHLLIYLYSLSIAFDLFLVDKSAIKWYTRMKRSNWGRNWFWNMSSFEMPILTFQSHNISYEMHQIKHLIKSVFRRTQSGGVVQKGDKGR